MNLYIERVSKIILTFLKKKKTKLFPSIFDVPCKNRHKIILQNKTHTPRIIPIPISRQSVTIEFEQIFFERLCPRLGNIRTTKAFDSSCGTSYPTDAINIHFQPVIETCMGGTSSLPRQGLFITFIKIENSRTFYIFPIPRLSFNSDTFWRLLQVFDDMACFNLC